MQFLKETVQTAHVRTGRNEWITDDLDHLPSFSCYVVDQ